MRSANYLIGVAATLCAMQAHALSVSFTSTPLPPSTVGSSSTDGYTLIDFDGASADFASFAGGSYQSVSNADGAAPTGGSGAFWTVKAGQTGTVSFSEDVVYYGFLWGSTDSYNTVTFDIDTNGVTQSVDFSPGTTVGLDVNQSWQYSLYFNAMADAGEVISGVHFYSGRNSFETDNHAALASYPAVQSFGPFNIETEQTIPAVPEPETYALMLGGLGLIAFVARRRRRG